MPETESATPTCSVYRPGATVYSRISSVVAPGCRASPGRCPRQLSCTSSSPEESRTRTSMTYVNWVVAPRSGRLQQHRRHLDERLDLGALGVGPIEPNRAHFQVVRRALLARLAGGRQAGQAEHRENLQSGHVEFHSQLGAGTRPAPSRLTSRPTE